MLNKAARQITVHATRFILETAANCVLCLSAEQISKYFRITITLTTAVKWALALVIYQKLEQKKSRIKYDCRVISNNISLDGGNVSWTVETLVVPYELMASLTNTNTKLACDNTSVGATTYTSANYPQQSLVVTVVVVVPLNY